MPVLLFLGAAIAGAVVASLRALWLTRHDPDDGRTRVVLKSAGFLPVFVAILVALISLWAVAAGFGETGERSPWLTVYIVSILGACVAIPAFLGGLAASLLIVRRNSR